MGDRIENPYELLECILAGVAKPRDLPLALLEDITKYFSEERKIGEGGFGTVYKGVLQNQTVAVKKIFVNKHTVDERLFRREVDSLMKINNHRNLVRFLGFCSNTARVVKEKTRSRETFYPQVIDRLLCFEYISKGSLDKYITDELRGLTWDARFDIIRGICDGLRYLHVDKSIIHLDLKPSNILLDDHMVPKITDFGLSRSAENTHTQGERFFTRGYCAPEYQIYGKTSKMADIYSLGVIIVELVTGSKDIPDETLVLRRWRHRWNKPQIQHQHQVIKCMEIAVCCRVQEPNKRPSITDIIRDLSEIGTTNGLIGQASLYLYDDMLGIEPLEIHFPLEHNKHTSCSVELTNETINSIAFKIRTPNEQYSTRPEKGIVLPGLKREVKITLQPHESATQATSSDKFVIQSTKVNEGLADEDIVDHMFNNKKVVDEVILDISLDQQEKAVSKDIGSSSYDNTRHGLIPPQFMYFEPLESISRNQATNLTSDRTVDLATGAIGSLLPKLTELINQYDLRKSIRSDVDCVIHELRVMRVDLCNVSEVQLDNNNEQIKLVKLWAGEVRELSYDIEDVVDGFLMQNEGSEHATCTGGLITLIQKMMGLSKLGRTRHRIGGAIKDMKHQLRMHAEGPQPDTSTGGLMQLIQNSVGPIKDIKNQVQHKSGWKGKYKVEVVVANTVSSSTSNAHHLSALVNDREKLFGIDDAMNDLTKRLSGAAGKELKVHSIFGSGGLGKTTLAMAVYNQLKGSFYLTAFVPVGRSPDVKKILYDILFEIDEQRYMSLKAANLDERQLIHVLAKLLKNNRYLIVIDDLWDKQVWHDFIKFALVDDKCGSKIIITTRIFEVATTATDVYKLDPLSSGYSEELFYATLSHEESRCDVTDEVIEKILSKCGGVPLAIITIASLLANKQREDWPKVYSSIGFGHEVDGNVDNTRKILLFSYRDLPRHLRTCLLHLSIFPEESLIQKDLAIWKWVAEGFVHDEPGRGLLEIGERYFNQLVSRSMVQMVGQTKVMARICFRIHDLVLDMICSLSKDENFVTVLETDDKHTSSQDNARRLAVQKRCTQPLSAKCMAQLRSFYATECHISVIPSLLSFKVLRVLSMRGCGFLRDHPYQLRHIGELVQLRYLGLEIMPFDKLPEDIGYLPFLQTLILNGSARIEELPRSVGLLRELKCLRAIHCFRLEVPDWMVNMTSIEDLALVGAYMSHVFVEGLGKLKELRDLQITGRDSPGDSWNRALVKSLENLPRLQTLQLMCFMPNADDIWEGFVPPRHLHRMMMGVAFSSVPPWMDSTHLPRLSYLELSLCYTDSRCLEILGRFPELHTLKLHSRIWDGPAVPCPGAFPKLRQLCSSAMMRFQRGVMQRLEYLELMVSIVKLKEANFDCDFTSLGNLPSLQKVKVELQAGMMRGDNDPAYAKMVMAAVKDAVDTHPHRRPILLLEDSHGLLKKC